MGAKKGVKGMEGGGGDSPAKGLGDFLTTQDKDGINGRKGLM